MVAAFSEAVESKEILFAGACNVPNLLVVMFRVQLILYARLRTSGIRRETWHLSGAAISAQKPLHGLVPNDEPGSQLLFYFFEKAEDSVNKRVYIATRP
jgi:hypothetical protein